MADKKDIPLVLLDVLQKYTDEEHILSTKELISIMENNYDVPIERRTLYVNIDLLKKYGYKISTWQDNGHGYYMEEHQFRKSEVFLLCNAVHSSHFISSSESNTLIKKLLSTLSNSQKQEYTDKVYLPNSSKGKNDLLMTNINVISGAIRDRKPVKFRYMQYDTNKKLVPRREKPYTVEPRYIVFRDSRAYLIATSDHYEGFAHYRLDRIAYAEAVKGVRVPPLPKDMDAYEYSRNMYYMFNDPAVTAVIRCENRVLDHVIDIFGIDCRILPADEGHFDVHVKGCAQGILLFAQQFLDAVEIVEPASLREQMCDRLSAAEDRYRKAE